MSVASNVSGLSVSINGHELSLEEAINSVYEGIQRHLNDSQNSLRMLAMLLEKDDISFRDGVEYSDKVNDDVDEMLKLFKDLKSILKQIVGKPTSEEDREWLKAHNEERKMKGK